MKKIIALVTVVSFMTVSTAGAFAQPTVNNKAAAKKVELRMDRSPALKLNAPQNKAVINSNKTLVGRGVATRNMNHTISNTNKYNSPIFRNNIKPQFNNNNRSGNNSNTALGIIGLGALMIAIAAAVNN
ncbi:MAG: hypothetical protein FWF87_07920 [Synergistaceae bacterium]|nr:hypothetical protein [Synergistaceae bacterium]